MIYDGAEFVPMATLVQHTLCGTLSGLSKVYRACGYRVGWAVFSGDLEHARDYLAALELLSSLRLCSNVPGAVGRADGARRLPEHPRADGAGRPAVRIAQGDRRGGGAQQVPDLAPPSGAMYAFIGVRADVLPDFDDQEFAMDLLEHKHVLVAPGISFNVPYRNHFRITNLPEPRVLATCSSASRSCSMSTRRMRPPQSDRI